VEGRSIKTQLVGSITSPFSRKVRICFIEKEIPYDLLIEDGWDVHTKLHQINPLGKIPCLILPNGHPIFDSSVIADYIDGMSEITPLFPKLNLDKAHVKTFEALADGLLDAAILARRERISRPLAEQSQVWIERQISKVQASLQYLSNSLGTSEYCYLNQFTIADIAIGCALDWLDFRLPEITWRTDYPNLDIYLSRLNLRPSFLSTDPRQSNP
jgi:glutathione S-transferase